MRGKSAGPWSAAVLAGWFAALSAVSGPASAQSDLTPRDRAIAADPAPSEVSVQSVPRRRGPTRLRVYPTYPGPNAVRQCEAHYEQEYRQSGTVIVPRMHCWWQRG